MISIPNPKTVLKTAVALAALIPAFALTSTAADRLSHFDITFDKPAYFGPDETTEINVTAREKDGSVARVSEEVNLTVTDLRGESETHAVALKRGKGAVSIPMRDRLLIIAVKNTTEPPVMNTTTVEALPLIMKERSR